MAKAPAETKCDCREPFTSVLDGDVECRCAIKVSDGGWKCWWCKKGMHTSPGYWKRLKKLPQNTGKATD
jgi:hypothetical protein